MEGKISIAVKGYGSILVPKRTRFEEIAKLTRQKDRWPVYAARRDNKLIELSSRAEKDCEIEFLDITNEDGMRIYKRGVSLVMIKAIKEIYGSNSIVVIEHSIKKNYYCEIRQPDITVTQDILDEIGRRMRLIIDQDLPIEKVTLKRDEAIEVSRRFNMEDKARLFKYRRASNVNMYRLGDFYDYFYGYMVPSTGYLNNFYLIPYEKGFLIRFPCLSSPEKLNDHTNLEKISSVLMEQLDWCRLMGVETVADLNDIISDGKFGELVRINEGLHEKKIAQIADDIIKRIDSLKLVLIAGPSSSGKTTFAQRLCVQLRVNGIIPHIINMDDYFINREDTPLDEFGKHDFENIESLDLKLFNEDLTSLIEGKRVEIPSYNFILGKREYNGRFMQLGKGEIIIIEGIHGLNDKLASDVLDQNKYKIFISPMTQLNVDNHNRVSISDSRLLRRIVRDHHFRGNSAAVTIDTWPYVTRGEERNIFPFQEDVDAIFNSATIYEICILKLYAEPLLFHVDDGMPEYITAKRLIKFLDYFLSAERENLPFNSILREFVGGSCFDV